MEWLRSRRGDRVICVCGWCVCVCLCVLVCVRACVSQSMSFKDGSSSFDSRRDFLVPLIGA